MPAHLPGAVLSPGRPPSFPAPATQAISPAVNPLASFLHPTPKPSLRTGRGCRLGRADPQEPYPAQRLGAPGLPAPPSLFPIIAYPKRGQNFPERTHPALAQGLLAAPGTGQRAAGHLGMHPHCFQRCPHLSFCSPGRGPLETPFRTDTPPPPRRLPSFNWSAGRRRGMVVLASRQGTLLETPEGPAKARLTPGHHQS